MKKENILVVAIICISIIGAVFYMRSKPVNDAIADVVETNSVVEKAVVEQKTDLMAANTSGIDWQPYAQGLETANAQNKPVFLYFHADWCKYCKKLKTTTFTDKAVLNYLNNNFISIIIDTEKERELSTEWGIKGLPNLWFLKADNSKISNLPGYVGPEQFLIVNQISEREEK